MSDSNFSRELSLKVTCKSFDKVKISSSQDTFEYARKFYFDDILIYESMFILLLDRSNNTIGYAKISQGGVAGTVMDIKIVALYAVKALASAVILVHNHPSGKVTPSEDDKYITKKLRDGLKLLDIDLLDSMVITDTAYYSLADEGVL